MAPRNEDYLRQMLNTAIAYDKGPSFIRYPRGCGPGSQLDKPLDILPIGTPEIVHAGTLCAIIAAGDFFVLAETAAALLKGENIEPAVVDARFVKPLDRNAYEQLFAGFTHIVTLENNSLEGGFGSALLSCAADCNLKRQPRFLRLGLPDQFVTHGSIEKLLTSLSLDPASISKKIKEFINC
jgi:1-deoxy-D-xylulose-5-phosphate synthase